MDLVKQRLPDLQQTWTVLLAIVFPVHFWALMIFLRELPAYLLRMPVWDILGVLAYLQIIALLDCLLLLVLVLSLAFILPFSWFRAQFTIRATLLSYAVILAVILLHIQDILPETLFWMSEPLWVWMWGGLIAAGCIAAAFWARRSCRVESWIILFLEKLNLLSTLYLGLSLAGLFVVAVRNLGIR